MAFLMACIQPISQLWRMHLNIMLLCVRERITGVRLPYRFDCASVAEVEQRTLLGNGFYQMQRHVEIPELGNSILNDIRPSYLQQVVVRKIVKPPRRIAIEATAKARVRAAEHFRYLLLVSRQNNSAVFRQLHLLHNGVQYLRATVRQRATYDIQRANIHRATCGDSTRSPVPSRRIVSESARSNSTTAHNTAHGNTVRLIRGAVPH